MFARAVQGREKRQRRGSSGSLDGKDEDGKSNMSSFRFPPPGDSPSSIRRSAPTTPRLLGERRQSLLNASAQPFTFSGFSSAVPFALKDPAMPLPHPLVPSIQGPDGNMLDSSPPKIETGESPMRGFPVSRQKRAPIPLNFTHPTHSNTVPAGLFKAMVNGDERTRRTVRSRLSRPSLDDLAVPQYPERPLDRDSPPNRCIHEIFLEKRTTFSVQRHSEVRHYPTQTIVLLSRPSLAYLPHCQSHEAFRVSTPRAKAGSPI